MKGLLRLILLNCLIVWLTASLIPGVAFDFQLKTLVLVAVALTVLNKTVKPLIKLFLLPINLLTVGLFGWVANVATLFIVTKLVPAFSLHSFVFSGWTNGGFVVPQMQFSGIWVYLLTSIVMSLLASVIGWVLSK